jgi:hypothetical protein
MSVSRGDNDHIIVLIIELLFAGDIVAHDDIFFTRDTGAPICQNNNCKMIATQ